MQGRRTEGVELFDSAGGLSQAYAAVDWAASIGPPADWSPALRATFGLMTRTRFPVMLGWGPDLVMLYNAAYVPLIADKHPAALGRPAREVFPEAWATIGPMFAQALGGTATWVEDELVPLQRRGRLEEAYFTFSYSPVIGADATVEGVIDIATETTDRVIDRRRLQLLGELRELVGTVERAADLRDGALELLATDPEDFPLAELQLEGAESPRASVGLPLHPAAPLGRAGLVVEPTQMGRVAWVRVGTSRERGSPQLLVVALSEHLAEDDAYLDYLRQIAFTLGQGLLRLQAREADRGLSETLQRSLLTDPVATDGLRVAARYLPAAAGAEVGGDWYDTFKLPDGSLAAVIGDVVGHDRRAAATMAQLRSLLRGVALSREEDSPDVVLERLDEVLAELPEDAVASVVLARVSRGPDGVQARFSNAGHLPPILLAADGTATLLETPPKIMLGVAAVRRGVHAVALEPGATLLLLTDGLVERRGVHLDESLAWLLGRVGGCQDLTPDALCDHLLADLGTVEDDVGLLAIRCDG